MKLLSFKTAAVFGAMLAVAGCQNISIGGFIESLVGDAKATVAGNFSCTPVEIDTDVWGVAIEGEFQFRDHGYYHTVNGKEHKFAFHGTVVDPLNGQLPYAETEGEACEEADTAFISLFTGPDGYCGEARIQPRLREGDDLFGVDLRFRIAAVDGGEPGPDAGDEVSVWVGPDNGLGCPGPSIFNEGPPTIYENLGAPLLGGNVQIPLPNGI